VNKRSRAKRRASVRALAKNCPQPSGDGKRGVKNTEKKESFRQVRRKNQKQHGEIDRPRRSIRLRTEQREKEEKKDLPKREKGVFF